MVAPNIDSGKQEQPNNVHEVPIPSGSLKSEMLLWCELAFHGAEQTNDEENGADQHVKTVKACGHEEC